MNRLADKSLMAEGHKTARSKDVDTISNVGPANYNIERVIGRKNIVQSNIASVPQVSFGQAQTFRTVDSRRGPKR